MREITIKTQKPKQILDITHELEKLLPKENGLVHVFVTHTTAALTTADLDPGTDLDMLDAFEAIIPKLNYRHPHDPSHVGDHIMSSIIGASVTVPVKDGKFILGTWQRIILVEFYGPKERNLILNFFPES